MVVHGTWTPWPVGVWLTNPLPRERRQAYRVVPGLGADVIASTHTCLPVLWSGLEGEQSRVVVNNGSAGMGNLQSDPRGPITRIGFSSPVTEPVAGIERHGLNVSLLPVCYSLEAWLPEFDRLWPASSPAAVSYRNRIRNGTSLHADDVIFPSSI